MKFINAICNWLKGVNERSHAKCQERRAKRLENISCNSINVIEFNGHFYISHDGVPIVRVEDLRAKGSDALSSMCEALRQAREDYLAWREKFNA